ncbi:MAG: FAD-binding oxidoreductase [Proteobacteria bacterium]|nr:FAD-binding oxidoreductase [Pseudomonadota bacterium]
MPIRPDHLESDRDIPGHADVVVIGGGVIGASTALYLAQKRISVVLCEKGEIAGEQSGRNWGWVRTIGRDLTEIPLAVESLRRWRTINRDIEAETGYREAGILYLCDQPKDVAVHEGWLDHVKAYQLDARLLDGAAVHRLVPGSARPFAGGLYSATDGRAEPEKAAPAIAAGARRAGAVVLTRCAVRGLDMEAGRVSGVITERGRIAAGSVVLAGGAWSRLFCGNLGLDFPQLKVLGSVMRTQPMDGPSELAVGGSDFAFRKRLDGGYTVGRRGATVAEIVPDSFRLLFDFLPALKQQRHELRLRLRGRFLEEWRTRRHWGLDETTPFEEIRILDPDPDLGILKEAEENLVGAFPAFRGLSIAERWAGLIDVMPDALPVIGPVASIPGFFLATSFSGHGFGIGPGAGALTADIVSGSQTCVDPSPFRLERFPRTSVSR